MKLLIENGADIDAVDDNKDSALILAVDQGKCYQIIVIAHIIFHKNIFCFS